MGDEDFPTDASDTGANPPSAWEGTGAPERVTGDDTVPEEPVNPPSAWEGTGAPERVTIDETVPEEPVNPPSTWKGTGAPERVTDQGAGEGEVSEEGY
jgi:hypothetical protein